MLVRKQKTKHTEIKNTVALPTTKIKSKPSVSPAIYKSAGGSSIDVNYSNSSEMNDCFKKLGGELKVSIDRRFKSKFPLNKVWDCVQFRIVNPTSIPCSFNLFDGFSITPVPNTPNGYVPLLNPIGIPQMNFPPSAGTTYPSYECAVVAEPPSPAGATNYATVYVPTTDRIYVVDSRYVHVINPNTNAVVNTIFLPNVNQGGNQAIFNPVNNKVYISSSNSGFIDIIDCATETTLPSFNSSSGNNIICMSYNPTNNTIYNAMGSGGNIEILNCATDTSGGFIPLSGNVNGVVVWVNGVNTYALALNSLNNTFYYINAALNSIISTLLGVTNCTGVGHGNSVIYNSVNNSVYYIDSAETSILEFSVSSFTQIGSIPCNHPTSLLYLSSYNIIYFDDFLSGNQVRIADCSTNTISNTVPVSLTYTAAPNPSEGQLSYDTSNNSVWVTRNYGGFVEEEVSKLCGTNAMCYIVGSEEYNEFCQDLRNNPVCVRQIQLFCQNSEQVATPMNLQTKDANGNLCTIPKLPNVTLSTDQFQPNIATVDFHCKDLVLDCLTTINQYTIQPNSEVNVVMYYKQVLRVDTLTSKQTVCKRVTETKCPDGDSRTEAQLRFQSPRPHHRPKWLKPFKPDMIKDGSGGTASDVCNTCFEETAHPIYTSKKMKVIEVDASDLVTVKRLDKADICGECIDNIGHPLMTEEKVTNIDIDINDVKTFKRLDKADNCGECIENIGHPIVKKLSKYSDESIGNLDILKVDLKMEQLAFKSNIKK